MKKLLRALVIPGALIIATGFTASAQTTPAEKRIDTVARKAVDYMNRHLPDSVYSLAGATFKQQITPALWQQVYSTQLSPMLPFTQVTFISHANGISRYRLEGKMPQAFIVGLDAQGKFNNFFLQPYPKENHSSTMTAQERKTDTLARKILGLMNRKQTDSVYRYASASFKKAISADKWQQLSEAELYPLLPLPEAIFAGSKNGVSKYKLGNLQFIIRLDEEGNYNTLALQPYMEEAVKTEAARTDNPMKSHIDSVANKVLSAYIQTKGNVGLSAGIWINGKAYYYNYGETRQGNAQLPTLHTLYDIGSITKTFTSTLLAIAVTQGKVTLATPITRLLPDSVAANPDLKNITLVELSNHTSGLPRMPDNFEATVTNANQPYEHYTTANLFSSLKHFKATRKPGEKYEYSNMAAALLGVLMERVYHQPYAELLREYITGPAHLDETHLTLNAADSQLLAQGYNEQGEPVPSWKFQAMQGAGAIKSSVYDMLNYGKLQLTPVTPTLAKALKLAHQVTFTNVEYNMGLGWHAFADNPKLIQHAGGTGGYRTLLCVDLERHIIVVLLTNNASTGDKTGLSLMEAIRNANH